MAHEPKIYVIIDNIRSTYNVGSIFRTCDGAGVSGLFLCGYTPTPFDRFGRKRNDIAKVALGAEESLKWQSREDIVEVIKELRDKNIDVVAVEQSDTPIPYKSFTLTRDTAFVFGTETVGLSQEVINACDMCIEIPMHGSKESLNVSVSVGVILFHFC